MYSSASCAHTVGASRTIMPTQARMPAASARAATMSGKKYMSLKQVVPPRIISANAKSAPTSTYSASTHFDSAGQICAVSHSSSGKSSA